MTVNYTTNLALGQPVTGTESGTWGDDVNNAVTSYLDIAIAGGLSVTVTTADVTLTLTQGTSVATNIGSTTAQYAILNVSGAMTAARNLILPSSSRQYVINNACTGGFLLTVKGSATTGVTLVNGEKAHVFWTGTDYSKLSNTPGGAGTFSSITNTGLTSGRVVFSTTAGLETDSANLTFDGTNLTLLGGTANGVTYLNASKVLTSGTAIQFDGTNLGIGVTPVSILHAKAASPIFTQETTANVTTGGVSYQQVKDSTGIVFVQGFAGLNNCYQFGTSIATGFMRFLTGSGTEAVRIDSSGNVGIGNTSLVGRLRTTLAADGLITLFNGTTYGLTFTSSSSESGAKLEATDPTGTASFQPLILNGSIQQYKTGGTERMRIDSSGNVGIGTSSPAAKLDIYTNSASGFHYPIFLSANNSVAAKTNYLQLGFSVQQSAAGSETGGFDLKALRNNTAVYLANYEGAAGSAAWRFYTEGSERMRIDTSGNVGIGTSSPAYKLDVQTSSGNAVVNVYQTASSGSSIASSVLRTAGTGPSWWNIDTGNTASGLNGAIRWFDNIAATERMRIDSNGNLLVGTTTAVGRLTVTSAATQEYGTFDAPTSGYAFLRLRYNGTSYGNIGQGNAVVTGGATTDFGLNATTNMLFATGGITERMRIDSSGNVGIGVTPSYKFQVQMPTSGTGAVFRYLGGTNNPGLFFSTDESTRVSDINASGSNGGILSFSVGNAEAMRIDSGNLLVGTTSALTVGKVSVGFNGTNNNGIVLSDTVPASGVNYALFQITGTTIGSIARVAATSAVVYNTTSDYRLKTVTGSVTGQGARIDALKPVDYQWKKDGQAARGFLAHEFQEVYANSVTGTKDAVDADGNPKYQAMQAATSEVIADLVAEIQSLRKRLTALEST